MYFASTDAYGEFTWVSSDTAFTTVSSTSSYTPINNYKEPVRTLICERCDVECLVPTEIDKITALTCPQCGGALREWEEEEEENAVEYHSGYDLISGLKPNNQWDSTNVTWNTAEKEGGPNKISILKQLIHKLTE